MSKAMAKAVEHLEQPGTPTRLEHGDQELDAVGDAVRNGEYGTARLNFLRMAEETQIRVLERIPIKDAVRLAGGLPAYTVSRLYERLPRHLGRAIVQALPEGKRHGVVVILNHRRRP